jgi:hypothetical protein
MFVYCASGDVLFSFMEVEQFGQIGALICGDDGPD